MTGETGGKGMLPAGHPWHRADVAVARLRVSLARRRGEGPAEERAGADVRWYHAGASGRRSYQVVSVSLRVVEAEDLVRLLDADHRARRGS